METPTQNDSFVPVAGIDEVPPGKTLKVAAGGQVILLANVEGRIYAIDDMCTHEDSSLALGCLKGELVSCTLHGSRFNVRTGEPTEEPAVDPVRTYAVRVDSGRILVDLS